MEIRNFSNTYSPNFQAKPIAKTFSNIAGINTQIDLWEISKKDSAFLHKLLKSVDMRKLMPDIGEFEAKRWKEMLEIAIDDTLDRNFKTFLAVTKNKPCGIISINPGKKNYHASCVCTWPVETGKKVKLAGKTLFYQLFKTFENSNAKNITLQAISDGPYKTVPIYKNLGFKITDMGRLTGMSIDKSRAKNTSAELAKCIEYCKIDNGESQNLLDILVI